MSVSPYLLKGQKVLVTDANSRIGEAVARYLAQAGTAVVVNYQSKPVAAQKIVDDIKVNQGEVIALQADVSQEDQVQALFKLYPSFAERG
ncbi:MAG: SDR family NAD(P)-dependent oxidoreductase [Rhizonema sp. PD37]|nr:SDR family NAD(P)-dependent oxidoreductase [Rhizonema sp. PD37]